MFTKKSVKTGIIFKIGNVLFGKLRPYLKNWFLPDFTGVAVGDFWVLEPQNINSKCLYYLIQTAAYETTANQSSGTKMPRSDWKLVSNTEFALPKKFEEQQKIGEYFRTLDHLITLHQQLLNDYAKEHERQTTLDFHHQSFVKYYN